MEYTKLNIYTQSKDLEPLMDRLGDIGVCGFEIHDAADFEAFLKSDVMRQGANWDYIGEELDPLKSQPTHLTLYLTKDSQGAEILGKIRELCVSENLRIEESLVREEDWAENWKTYFKPFEVGERLLIKPTWEAAPATERVILEIDPASAFGTGQHESTRLCLEALEKLIAPGCTFLDLGCGSGILTIAALLLGAKNAVMVDVSENAVKVAAENLAQNGVSAAAFRGDITKDAELLKQIGSDYDVITANIVADVIIKMSVVFPKLLKKDGVLVTSGIIEARLDEVKTALESAGLRVIETKTDNGWCVIHSCRI
jgi:ribosomal protein L11 methyltransferase